MSDKTIKTFIKDNFLQILIQVFAIVFLVLNLWLASTLAPISQDIAVIKTNVQAMQNIDETKVDKTEFNQVITRLNTISARVDTIINMLIKK